MQVLSYVQSRPILTLESQWGCEQWPQLESVTSWSQGLQSYLWNFSLTSFWFSQSLSSARSLVTVIGLYPSPNSSPFCVILHSNITPVIIILGFATKTSVSTLLGTSYSHQIKSNFYSLGFSSLVCPHSQFQVGKFSGCFLWRPFLATPTCIPVNFCLSSCRATGCYSGFRFLPWFSLVWTHLYYKSPLINWLGTFDRYPVLLETDIFIPFPPPWGSAPCLPASTFQSPPYPLKKSSLYTAFSLRISKFRI